MFDLERSIRDWQSRFRKFESFEDGALAELESHLRDEFEHQKESGASDEQAFAAAIAIVGKPDVIGTEYFKDGARSALAAPPWSSARFSPMLIGSHIKVALRKIRRRKGISFLNIFGLAVGIAAGLLILLWVRDERGFDRFHRDAGRLYALVLEDRRADGLSFMRDLPFPVADTVLKEYSGIEAVARTYRAQYQVRYRENAFNENAVAFVDPAYFQVFTFPATAGDSVGGLSDASSIVLTEETANKYFGDENPLGKILILDNRNPYRVAAVVKVPRNTDVRFDLYLPLRSLERWGMSAASLDSNWRGRNFLTYVKLRLGENPHAFEEKTAGLLKRHNPGRDERLRLQPLADIHLYGPDGKPARKRIVVVLSLVASLILTMACVNYMNLTTARAGTRAKEIGLRKTVGARRSQLIRQIFAESLLLAFLALALSLVLITLALPTFNRLTGKNLSLGFNDPTLVLGLIGVAFLTGVLSGFYPALVLSSFKPAAVLKARAASPQRGARLRKILLVFQFSVSVLLLIATTVILSQLRNIRTRDIGFDRDNLIYAPLMGEHPDDAEFLKRDLEGNPRFLGACACDNLPTNIPYQFSADWEGRASAAEVEFNYTVCDVDYVKTLGMTIVQGRDFSRGYPTDKDAFLINEEAARQMGAPSPLGIRLRFMGGRWGEIIGVVKDFNFRNMGSPIRPLVLTPRGRKGYLLVRFKPGDPEVVLRDIRAAWNRANPGFVFSYGFVDQNFDTLYTNERQLGKIIGSFSLLAVIISCLGLVGLVSFTAEQKTKEIGIRKVLGAGSVEIVRRLAGEFLKWILLANAIAWPIGAWIMGRWLENYVYRIGLAPWMFGLAGLATLVVTLATISVQTLRAAAANPVDSLRSE
jgi:putative ABC transport system permease protein